VFPTDEMKQTVASIYIEIVDLIERATKYYCLGILSKKPEKYPANAMLIKNAL